MAVWILDTRKKPLMPCSEKRARVHRLVGRLREKSAGHVWVTHGPGSQTAGVALVGEKESSGPNERHREQTVLALLERTPRGQAIREALTPRRAFRRPRRGHLRPALFAYRVKPKGWLAPSLQHRVDTGQAIVAKGQKAGTYLGRVAIRARGSADIQTRNGLAPGIHHRFRTLMQRADGHGYSLTKITLDKGEAGMERALSAVLSLPGTECQGFPRK